MKAFRFAVLTVFLSLLSSVPTYAQWQTPAHSVPIGQGGGVTGFGSAGPGAVDLPLMGNGPNADPSFRADPTVPHLATDNVFTGSNTFNNAYFSGRPSFDVRSSEHSCTAAVGDGSTVDTAAIQCHINYMSANFGGGVVFFPPGTYLVAAGGFTVPAGVWLVGVGPASAIVVNTDSRIMSFQISGTTCPVGNHYGGVEKIDIFGYANAAATQDTVYVGDNCNVTIRDTKIWYGANALKMRGVDSHIFTSFIWGYQSAITSNGANWYIRVKIDAPIAHTSTYAFIQGQAYPGGGVMENTFVACDFSGLYTYSVNIQDTNNSSITKFFGGIFSAPIVIVNASTVVMVGGELGSATLTVGAGQLLMSSTVALTPVTVTGAGSRSCAGNSANITC